LVRVLYGLAMTEDGTRGLRGQISDIRRDDGAGTSWIGTLTQADHSSN